MLLYQNKMSNGFLFNVISKTSFCEHRCCWSQALWCDRISSFSTQWWGRQRLYLLRGRSSPTSRWMRRCPGTTRVSTFGRCRTSPCTTMCRAGQSRRKHTDFAQKHNRAPSCPKEMVGPHPPQRWRDQCRQPVL